MLLLIIRFLSFAFFSCVCVLMCLCFNVLLLIIRFLSFTFFFLYLILFFVCLLFFLSYFKAEPSDIIYIYFLYLSQFEMC